MLENIEDIPTSQSTGTVPSSETGPLSLTPLSRPAPSAPSTVPLAVLPTRTTARTPPSVSSSGRIVAAALAMGWAVVFLFYGQKLGISYPLFMLLLVGALLLLGRVERVTPIRGNLWLIGGIAYFSTMVFVRANGFVTLLNLGASLALLTLLAYYFSAGRVQRLGLLGYPIVMALSLAQSLARPVPLVASGISRQAGHTRGMRRLAPVLRGVVIATPVLFVFACLLASADRVFSDLLTNTLQLAFVFDFGGVFGRVTVALASAWIVAGGLLLALTRHKEPDANNDPNSLTEPFHIGFIEATTLLILVDLLFLVFAWIQFSYLFGMQEWAARGAWDYRDYARRGFGELIVVALLTMLMILGLHHISWRETARQTRIFKGLSTLMVGLVLVFLASAWQRMFYWEQVEAYMFTQTRIFVRIFIAWLAVLMGWLLVTLWRLPKRFAIGAFVAVLGYIATLNAVNPDTNVVQYNLNSYMQSGVIDDQYLNVLSEDAVPAIVAAYDTAPANRKDLLRAHLQGRLERMDADPAWREWQAFQLSRWEAYRLLDARRGELKP